MFIRDFLCMKHYFNCFVRLNYLILTRAPIFNTLVTNEENKAQRLNNFLKGTKLLRWDLI